jgi:hypothetical protein
LKGGNECCAAPIAGTKVLMATDGSRWTDTKILHLGAYGDSGCAQTTGTIPYPPFSPVYRFAIYFTNNVPTNAHPMVLMTGLNPWAPLKTKRARPRRNRVESKFSPFF